MSYYHPHCCDKTLTKHDLREERVCLAYWSTSKGSQGKDLKTGTEAETTEDCCLLTCSRWLAQLPFLNCCGPPVSGAPLTVGSQCTPTTISNPENALPHPQTCPQVDSQDCHGEQRLGVREFSAFGWCHIVSKESCRKRCPQD